MSNAGTKELVGLAESKTGQICIVSTDGTSSKLQICRARRKIVLTSKLR